MLGGDTALDQHVVRLGYLKDITVCDDLEMAIS